MTISSGYRLQPALLADVLPQILTLHGERWFNAMDLASLPVPSRARAKTKLADIVYFNSNRGHRLMGEELCIGMWLEAHRGVELETAVLVQSGNLPDLWRVIRISRMESELDAELEALLGDLPQEPQRRSGGKRGKA